MSLISSFRLHIEELAGLIGEAWSDLEQILEFREYPNAAFYLEEGKRSTNEVFLLKGVLRGFYRTYEGSEINVSFFQDGSVLPPHYIRTRNQLSLLNIQALSEVTLAEFNAESFTALRYKHPCLMTYGNRVVELELEYKTRREIFMLTKSAEEKYKVFREVHPGLENRIPQYHIASYLGITPVSLSRLRKNLSGR